MKRSTAFLFWGAHATRVVAVAIRHGSVLGSPQERLWTEIEHKCIDFVTPGASAKAEYELPPQMRNYDETARTGVVS